MSTSKVPSQFPWIVTGVVIVHAILAVFLFGGGKDPYPEAAAAAKEAQASIEPEKEEAPSAAVTAQAHPFSSAEVEDKAFSAKDNPEFKSRFPKRVPLQSELSGAVLPEPTRTSFALKEKEAAPRDDQPANNASAVMTAVTAAKVSPYSLTPAETEVVTSDNLDLPESANRIRMIEVNESFPVPQPISVERDTPRAEQISIEMTAPAANTTESPAKVRPESTPEESEPNPVVPQSGRKFRVVKPLPRK